MPDSGLTPPRDLAVRVEPLDRPLGVVLLHFAAAPGLARVSLDGRLLLEAEVPAEATLRVVGLPLGAPSRLEVTLDASDARWASGEVLAEVPPPPASLPLPNLVLVDPGRSWMDQHQLLLSHYADDASYVSVLDGQARLRWLVGAEGPEWKINRTRPSRDGRSALWSVYKWDRSEDWGKIERLAWDGSFATSTRALEQHHDFTELADGRLAWLGWSVRSTFVDGRLLPLAAVTLHRAEEGSDTTTPETLFSLHDDYAVEPFLPCEHSEPGTFLGVAEWDHANSLVWDETRGAAFILGRFLDAFWLVDAEGGGLRWQLGGRESDFTLVGPGRPVDHGHFSEHWTSGALDHLLVFDNRNHDDAPSRVVQLEVDEAARTYRQVAEWVHPEGRKTHFLGDARRLPNGNILVAWGNNGLLQEFTPAGELVWSVSWGQVLSRVDPLLDWP